MVSMKCNKFSSNVLSQNIQLILSNRLKQLKSKQTYTKTRNIRVINKFGRYTKEHLNSSGWKDKEIKVLNFYDRVWIKNGIEVRILHLADIIIHRDTIHTVRQDILETI